MGRLIAKLLTLYRQIEILKDVSHQIAVLAEEAADYETMRQHVTSSNLMTQPSDFDSLVKATEEISGMLPLEAVRLQGTIDLLQKNRTATLNASTQNREYYFRMLSIYESGLEMIYGNLRKMILRLSWRHGLVTWINGRAYIREIESKAAAGQEVLRKFGTEMRTALAKAEAAQVESVEQGGEASHPDSERSTNRDEDSGREDQAGVQGENDAQGHDEPKKS